MHNATSTAGAARKRCSRRVNRCGHVNTGSSSDVTGARVRVRISHAQYARAPARRGYQEIARRIMTKILSTVSTFEKEAYSWAFSGDGSTTGQDPHLAF